MTLQCQVVENRFGRGSAAVKSEVRNMWHLEVETTKMGDGNDDRIGKSIEENNQYVYPFNIWWFILMSSLQPKLVELMGVIPSP